MCAEVWGVHACGSGTALSLRHYEVRSTPTAAKVGIGQGVVASDKAKVVMHGGSVLAFPRNVRASEGAQLLVEDSVLDGKFTSTYGLHVRDASVVMQATKVVGCRKHNVWAEGPLARVEADEVCTGFSMSESKRGLMSKLVHRQQPGSSFQSEPGLKVRTGPFASS